MQCCLKGLFWAAQSLKLLKLILQMYIWLRFPFFMANIFFSWFVWVFNNKCFQNREFWTKKYYDFFLFFLSRISVTLGSLLRVWFRSIDSIPWVYIYTMSPCLYQKPDSIPWVHVHTMSLCQIHASISIPWQIQFSDLKKK